MPVTKFLPRAGGYARALLPWRGSGWGDGLTDRRPHRRTVLYRLPALGMLMLLAACATQSAGTVEPQAPGFLLGLWHGFIFPVAWVLSIFMPDVSIYAVPNNGGWYDFGYFVGVVFLGVGARKSHVVYRDRVVRR
jgi:hypothetical protein